MQTRAALKAAIISLGLAWAGVANAEPQDLAAASSQTAIQITLEEAVALALRDNRGMRSLRMWRVLDRFDLFLAKRAYWPEGGIALSAIRRKSASGEERDDIGITPSLSWRSPIGTSTALSWSRQETSQDGAPALESFSATVRQPLLRGAGLDVNMAPLRQAELGADLAFMREEEAVANLIDQVTYAYRDLVQDQERLELARLSLQRSRQLLETNTLLIEAGRMAAADIFQTQSEVANQEVQLLETERGVNNTRIRLLTLLALDPSTPLHIVDDFEVNLIEIDTEQAVEQALSTRRDLQAMRLNFEQLELSEKLARNSRLWDMSVIGTYDRYNTGGGGPDVSEHSVGVQLSVPLGDFSGRRNVMSARTALHTTRLSYEGSLERVEAEVREAVADVHSRWRQLEAALRAKDLAQRSLDLQIERLQAGRATNFEVLSIQNNVRMADAQALSARIAYLNALTSLDQKTGRTLEAWQISLQP